ncbi:MAG: undecaprenyl-phosphate glucose phosphotransferase [Verrucomicrobiae bacterium]|nr:undecaprenyl-phosphate glucose phosphotransferase [Verrucomicrobiae bacterium]
MLRRKDVRLWTVAWTLASDAAAMYLAFACAWIGRFKLGVFSIQDVPAIGSYLAAVTLWTVVLLAVFQRLGLYNIRVPLPFLAEAARVAQGMTISLAVLFALSFFLRAQYRFSRLTVGIMAVLGIVWLLLLRNALRASWGRFLRRRRLLLRSLIVGWGERGAELILHVRQDDNSGREVVGVLSEEAPTDLPEGTRWLGRCETLESQLDELDLDEVILATLHFPSRQISLWILACEQRLVAFRLIPDLFEVLASRMHLDFVSGVPLLGLGDFPLDHPVNRVLKRSLDVTGALVGLACGAPLMLAAAAAIRLESRGRVFYSQERCGREGRPFRMYKLRTMRADAEKESGPVWAKENDPRRTRTGAFLRRFNLDELPQFWNVLKGDMSLVGPRPERPVFVEQFKEEIRHYMPRHAYKPGMTGWAQVNGLRGNTPIEERVRYDLFYFENWSPWFDLRILVATIFSFRNAY